MRNSKAQYLYREILQDRYIRIREYQIWGKSDSIVPQHGVSSLSKQWWRNGNLNLIRPPLLRAKGVKHIR